MPGHLMKIYANTGLCIKEFSEIAQISNVSIIKNRLVDFVTMYEKHPDRLKKLIKECAKNG